jgi:hypothetical protein
MAVGLSESEANSIIDGFSGGWLQLHVGDPGAAGTANPAEETSRQQVTLDSASGGTATNSNVVEWTGITGSEDATHLSLWSASTAGTFRISGVSTSPPYVAGNTFRYPAGSITFTATGLAA